MNTAMDSFPRIAFCAIPNDRWCFLVPMYRDFHFYWAHRFIHIRVLYKYVHSLHHRNTDIDPFSGLCMHPVEHLYYYSCVGPSLVCLMSPLGMYWNLIHLLISPAASHSGWEDHFQSDQFHYLHHRRFECNYGTNGIPFDHWFGTFRDRLGGRAKKKTRGQAKKEAAGAGGDGTTYRGHGDDADGELAALQRKAAAAARGQGGATPLATSSGPGWSLSAVFAASWDQLAFNAGCVLICAALYAATAGRGSCGGVAFPPALVGNAHAMALLASVGPMFLGFVLWVVTSDRFSLRWPFHKDPIVGSFGLHFVVGFVVSVMPVYGIVHAVLAPAGSAFYCHLWGAAACTAA